MNVIVQELIPFIVTISGTVVGLIIGVVVWGVRLEAKILFIESRLGDDRKEIKEMISVLSVKIDQILEAQNKQWTRIAVVEAKLQDNK